MKLVVMGISGAGADALFSQEDLPNFRRLMELGCYGRLGSVVPSGAVPGWMCMATGQDPGELGVFGPRVRADRSYGTWRDVDWASIDAPTVWDRLAGDGKKSVVIGVPPVGPPRRVNGVFVGVPEDASEYPTEWQPEIARILGDRGPGADDDLPGRVEAAVDDTSRRRLEAVRHVLRVTEWDYAQFVETGLDRLQRAFRRHRDFDFGRHDADGRYENVVRAHFRRLDDEVGSLLEMFDEETALLVVSDGGAGPSDAAFCVNEWLVNQRWLVLNDRPREVTPFSKLDVDWSRTTCWSDGGGCARIHMNVRGREPSGLVDPADYERVRDEIKARLEAAQDDVGTPLGAIVLKPHEIHRQVRAPAPDLIAQFGARPLHAVAGVGYGAVSVRPRSEVPEPDDCHIATNGAFILVSPGRQPHGEIEGVHLLDVAPTLLDLGGHEVPTGLHGRSLLRRADAFDASAAAGEGADEKAIMDRLSGLGYV